MTLNELKAKVRAHFDGNHEIANQWVKDNFGKLTLKQTWLDALDRLSETIAAKADQTANEIIETAKATFTYDNITAAAFTATATLTRLAQRSVELAVMVGVFAYFLAIELRKSGVIQKTLDRMAQLDSASVSYWDLEPNEMAIVAHRSPLLASSHPISA